MIDEPISAAELAELKRLRKGKPPSNALPQDSYRNQEAVAQYERERAEKRMKRGKK